MNFVCCNYSSYLQLPSIHHEDQSIMWSLWQLDYHIKPEILSESEKEFIAEVKRRIKSRENLDEEEKIRLAKLIRRNREISD